MTDTLQISLRAARVNAGMTQDDVCEELRVSKRTLGHWENGQTKIPAIYLTRLSEMYQMPLKFIFLGKTAT